MPTIRQKVRRMRARKAIILPTCLAYVYTNKMVIIAVGDPADKDWDYLTNHYGFAGVDCQWHPDNGVDYYVLGDLNA